MGAVTLVDESAMVCIMHFKNTLILHNLTPITPLILGVWPNFPHAF